MSMVISAVNADSEASSTVSHHPTPSGGGGKCQTFGLSYDLLFWVSTIHLFQYDRGRIAFTLLQFWWELWQNWIFKEYIYGIIRHYERSVWYTSRDSPAAIWETHFRKRNLYSFAYSRFLYCNKMIVHGSCTNKHNNYTYNGLIRKTI